MNHVLYMRRALELAEWGGGYVSPNPKVGCVIVHQDRIIGEGWHRAYGGPHAEVHAVNSVENQMLLPESTVYVTLEPCAHWGKTPPCANLLVEKKVKKVIIAATDSNPLVGGKGIEILKNAGIAVETGVLEEESRRQNRRFFTQIEKQRPYVILKWAQTEDGFVARENFDSKWISNSQSRQLVHK
nr:bifunctional diaminohydroxyphosphoribosylaminopyrimidine deaminase/5-amino-6-(5-phosphoribosylamino)uracil reductase RibD [Algoriphagus sp.]